MSLETTITLAANAAIALSFLAALIFGIAQVRAAERDRRERLTLETVRSFQTREFAELVFHVQSRDIPTTREEFLLLPAEKQIIFIQLGQAMESLGMLVAERYIDLNLIDKTLGSFVTTAWDRYKEMFFDMRKVFPDPYLGEYFQWLAERVEKRMAENPRPPFHEAPDPKTKYV